MKFLAHFSTKNKLCRSQIYTLMKQKVIEPPTSNANRIFKFSYMLKFFNTDYNSNTSLLGNLSGNSKISSISFLFDINSNDIEKQTLGRVQS